MSPLHLLIPALLISAPAIIWFACSLRPKKSRGVLPTEIIRGKSVRGVGSFGVLPPFDPTKSRVSEPVKFFDVDGYSNEPIYIIDGDPVCVHGMAMDVHCCECRRRGFFPPDDCSCYDTARPLNTLVDGD